jgi:hypothetical protein
MTSRPGASALPSVTRLVAVVLLVVPLAPHLAAQSRLPRFERGNCLVEGDWAREVRRECGWLVVPESRDRASTRTLRLAVEILRARQRAASRHASSCMGARVVPGGSVCTRRASRGVHCPCIATS